MKIKLTESYEIEEKHCQRTDCQDKAIFEQGFRIGKIEYFINLCRPCRNEFIEGVGGYPKAP